MNLLTKKIFISVLATFLFTHLLLPANLIQENFASGIPAGWTASGVTATSYSGKTCVGMASNGYIITPVLYKPANLTFFHRASGNGKTLTVEKQVNGGSWVLVGTISPTSYTTFISSSFSINETGSNVKIRFTANSATIHLSDIIITAGAKPFIHISSPYISFPGLYFVNDISSSENFSVTAEDLTSDINVTAPANFQVSLNNTDFSGSVNIQAGTTATTIYTRFVPQLPQGTETGYLELKSTGATTVKVLLSATAISQEPEQQGAITLGNTTGTTASITLSGGDGTGILLIGKAGKPVTFVPVDGVKYISNPDVSSSVAQSDSSMILYEGPVTDTIITGLEPGSQYYLAAFSFNAGTNNSHNYLVSSPGTGDFQTQTVPGLNLSPAILEYRYVLLNDSITKPCNISGKFLTPGSGDITITVPEGFKIALQENGTFSQILQIPYSDGILASTTFFVNFKPSVVKNYVAEAVVSGGGASVNLSLTGNGVTVMPILPKVYYIAPDGEDTNTGTLASPWFNLSKAITAAEPGDTIYVRGGTYYFTSVIRMTKSGTAGKRIHIFAYKNGNTLETPIFNFSSMACEGENCSSSRGLYITGSYWYIFGIHITKALDNGIKMEGSHNIIERCIFSYNGDSGIQLGFGHTITFTQDGSYCGYNYIIDCDSYRNYDPDNRGSDADGFACKMHNGAENWFIRCRAWENSDDAWDLYETDFPVYILECWGWSSGDPAEHPVEGGSFQGNGNGIKCGGNGTGGSSKGKHVVWNCVAFNNNKTSSVKGFDQNSHKGGVKVVNCLGFGNGYDFMYEDAPNSGITNDFYNNVCLGRLEINSISSIQQNNTVTVNPAKGWLNNLNLGVSAADYTDLSETAAMAPRGENGSLPTGFARLADASNLIDKGVTLPYPIPDIDEPLRGNALQGFQQIVYGNARDLGPYEKSIITRSQIGLLVTPEAGSTLKIYPNPYKENSYIQFSAGETAITELLLIQTDGRLIKVLYKSKAEKGLSYQIPVELPDLKRGIYLCILKVNGTVVKSGKIVKMN